MKLEDLIKQSNAKAPRTRRHDEDDLQTACVRWFDMQYPQYQKLLHHSVNEGRLHRGMMEGVKRKRMGMRAGFPDLIFLLPAASTPFVAIEMKTPKGRLSESQKQYKATFEAIGARYEVCRSVEQFIDIIKKQIWKAGLK